MKWFMTSTTGREGRKISVLDLWGDQFKDREMVFLGSLNPEKRFLGMGGYHDTIVCIGD